MSAAAAEGVLEAEAAALGRYLVGETPDAELRARYAAACTALLAEPEDPADARLVALAVRRPGLLPLLDAGAGVARPDALLRRKLLVLAAVLEATPRHAERFLDAPRSRPALALAVLAHGARAALQAALGAPLVAALGRRAR